MPNSGLHTVEQMLLSQGSHECLVSGRSEGDLFTDYDSCQKNREHHGFIPIDKFALDSLPVGYQNNYLLQCILALVSLVVRVDVTYISGNRSANESNNNRPYPFAEFGGNTALRRGSGWLRKVWKFQNETCSCESCRLSESPKTEGTKLIIRTAAHIVYDCEEGRHTQCHFFFDQGDSVKSCKTAVTFTGAVDVVSDAYGDWCDMTFVTHDEDQGETFVKMIADYKELHQKVWDDYPKDTVVKDSPLGEDLNLAIIISHPHACSKKISIGDFQRREELAMHDHFTHYIYTTATCQGSSGAPVFILGRSRRWPWCSHPHSGHCDHDRRLNYSGLGTN